ncbi:winged helix-turn-helix domain-containing protein [Haloactinospora alba]
MYRQIASIIARRVEDGTYPPHALLPTEAELCAEFDVSRRTVRSAHALLREQGWIVSSPGKGTYARGLDGY